MSAGMQKSELYVVSQDSATPGKNGPYKVFLRHTQLPPKLYETFHSEHKMSSLSGKLRCKIRLFDDTGKDVCYVESKKSQHQALTAAHKMDEILAECSQRLRENDACMITHDQMRRQGETSRPGAESDGAPFRLASIDAMDLRQLLSERRYRKGRGQHEQAADDAVVVTETLNGSKGPGDLKSKRHKMAAELERGAASGGPVEGAAPAAGDEMEEDLDVPIKQRRAASSGAEVVDSTREGHRRNAAATAKEPQRIPSSQEELLVLGGGGRVEFKVGSDVEMLFSDGVWYRGWISKWLGGGKKDKSKVAVIDFEDGDRQKVELPHPEVRPLQPENKDPGKKEVDLYPVGACVEMLFDDCMGYRGPRKNARRQSRCMANMLGHWLFENVLNT